MEWYWKIRWKLFKNAAGIAALSPLAAGTRAIHQMAPGCQVAASLAQRCALFPWQQQIVLVKRSPRGWRSGRGHRSLTHWSIQRRCFHLLCLLLFPSAGFPLSVSPGAMGVAANPLLLPISPEKKFWFPCLYFNSQLADYSLRYGNSNTMKERSKKWKLPGIAGFYGEQYYISKNPQVTCALTKRSTFTCFHMLCTFRGHPSGRV